MAIGIIGGSGVYDPKVLENITTLPIQKTPYGKTSDKITKGIMNGKEVYIIPRHGSNHEYSPNTVPYRANIHALKELGVTKIITVSAVGSLKQEYKPGDFVFTDQFIDRTTKRNQSFTGKVHISVAEPFCPDLRKKAAEVASKLNLEFHEKGVCVVIEGPRFSTIAESNVYRTWNADIINMTLVPEVVLAREAEICYLNIAMVTDYDSWKKDNHVSHAEVLKTMKNNMDKVRELLTNLIPEIDDEYVCSCNTALKGSEM